MNLPPCMDTGGLKDWLMADLAGDDRLLFEPIAEQIVDDIFARRGQPRTILTPLAVSLAKAAVRDMGGLR